MQVHRARPAMNGNQNDISDVASITPHQVGGLAPAKASGPWSFDGVPNKTEEVWTMSTLPALDSPVQPPD